MKPMSRSRKDLKDNNFWSAHKFQYQAEVLLDWLEHNNIPFKIGRTCLHIGGVKLYPHYNGRKNNTFTIVKNNIELITFDDTCDVLSVIKIIEKEWR